MAAYSILVNAVLAIAGAIVRPEAVARVAFVVLPARMALVVILLAALLLAGCVVSPAQPSGMYGCPPNDPVCVATQAALYGAQAQRRIVFPVRRQSPVPSFSLPSPHHSLWNRDKTVHPCAGNHAPYCVTAKALTGGLGVRVAQPPRQIISLLSRLAAPAQWPAPCRGADGACHRRRETSANRSNGTTRLFHPVPGRPSCGDGPGSFLSDVLPSRCSDH